MSRDLATLSDFFAALADPTRLRIVGLLTQGEICVCDLHETLKIPQPKASRHLAYLRKAGLVTAEKRGLWVHYRLVDDRSPAEVAMLAELCEALTATDIVKRDTARFARTMCCTPETAPARKARRR